MPTKPITPRRHNTRDRKGFPTNMSILAFHGPRLSTMGHSFMAELVEWAVREKPIAEVLEFVDEAIQVHADGDRGVGIAFVHALTTARWDAARAIAAHYADWDLWNTRNRMGACALDLVCKSNAPSMVEMVTWMMEQGYDPRGPAEERHRLPLQQVLMADDSAQKREAAMILITHGARLNDLVTDDPPETVLQWLASNHLRLRRPLLTQLVDHELEVVRAELERATGTHHQPRAPMRM